MGRGCTNDQTGDQKGGLSTSVHLCWDGKGCDFFFTGAELTLSGSILDRWYDVSRERMSPGWEEEGKKKLHGDDMAAGEVSATEDSVVQQNVRALLSGVIHLSFNQGHVAFLRVRLALFLVLGTTCELNIHRMSCPYEGER